MSVGCAFVTLGSNSSSDIVRDFLALFSPKFLDHLRFLPCVEIIPSFSICTCCSGSHDTTQQMLLPHYGLIGPERALNVKSHPLFLLGLKFVNSFIST